MKDLLFCVHVAVKTLNLENSRRHYFGRLRQIILLKCVRTCSTIIFPHSSNQIIVFWRRRCCCRRPCLRSLITQKARQHTENNGFLAISRLFFSYVSASLWKYMEKHKVKQDSKAFQLVRYSTAEWNFFSVIFVEAFRCSFCCLPCLKI